MAQKANPKPGAARARQMVAMSRFAGSFKERYAAGKALRTTCPREDHAAWKPPRGMTP